MNKLDGVLVASVLAILAFAGYHLYANHVFDPTALGESILAILTGHGLHQRSGELIDAKYAPDATPDNSTGKP